MKKLLICLTFGLMCCSGSEPNISTKFESIEFRKVYGKQHYTLDSCNFIFGVYDENGLYYWKYYRVRCAEIPAIRTKENLIADSLIKWR